MNEHHVWYKCRGCLGHLLYILVYFTFAIYLLILILKDLIEALKHIKT